MIMNELKNYLIGFTIMLVLPSLGVRANSGDRTGVTNPPAVDIAQQQTVTVKGKVTDTAGEPLRQESRQNFPQAPCPRR